MTWRSCVASVSLFALGAMPGCAHAPGSKGVDPWQPQASDAVRIERPLEELQAGLAIYRSHCGGCHLLFPVDSQSAQQWPKWVEDMTERARLDPEQAKLVTQYLVTIASRPGPQG